MKETFYFTHDFNARNDPKLVDVLIEHGAAGIGIFWCIIEQLYEQQGALPLKTCKSIAFALHVECSTVESIINDFNLFQTDGKMFWSNSVLARLERIKSISEKRKQAAAKRWKSIAQCNCDANAEQEESKPMQNKIKENKIKENTSSIEEVSNGEQTAFAVFPPTLQEIQDYIKEKELEVDPEKFFNFYESKGWFVGKNKMKNWRAAIANWARTEKERPHYAPKTNQKSKKANDEWT